MQYILFVVLAGIVLLFWRRTSNHVEKPTGNGGDGNAGSWFDGLKKRLEKFKALPEKGVSVAWRGALLAILGWILFQVSIAYLFPDIWGKITQSPFLLANLAVIFLASSHALGGPKWLRWLVGGPVAVALAITLWPDVKDNLPVVPKTLTAVESQCGADRITETSVSWEEVRVPAGCKMIFTVLGEGMVNIMINRGGARAIDKNSKISVPEPLKIFSYKRHSAIPVKVSVELRPM